VITTQETRPKSPHQRQHRLTKQRPERQTVSRQVLLWLHCPRQYLRPRIVSFSTVLSLCNTTSGRIRGDFHTTTTKELKKRERQRENEPLAVNGILALNSAISGAAAANRAASGSTALRHRETNQGNTGNGTSGHKDARFHNAIHWRHGGPRLQRPRSQPLVKALQQRVKRLRRFQGFRATPGVGATP
jgi:hypothetical protein